MADLKKIGANINFILEKNLYYSGLVSYRVLLLLLLSRRYTYHLAKERGTTIKTIKGVLNCAIIRNFNGYSADNPVGDAESANTVKTPTPAIAFTALLTVLSIAVETSDDDDVSIC